VSTQGTGSISAYSFELQLLQSWGDWARGDIGLWYSSLRLWQKSGVGFSFSEDDMCTADAAIARLGKGHQSTLKKWFIAGKGHKIDEQKKQAAIASFSESLSGDDEEPA
jgi:hypothetical protein